jgi:hypothetical protein
MAELVEEGKVHHIGVSNFDVTLLERCERVRHVDPLQPPLSLIDRRALAELLPWCVAHSTGVLCYSPMQSGLLSGSFSLQRAWRLPRGDWRARDPEFQQPRLETNLAGPSGCARSRPATGPPWRPSPSPGWLCVSKTTARRFKGLAALIEAHPPYEVPEITATPISHGTRDYLSWMSEEASGVAETERPGGW